MAYVISSHCLATIDMSRKVQFLSIDMMEVTFSIEATYDGHLSSICYNYQRNEVAVGDESGEIKIFGCKDGKIIHIDQSCHAKPITSLGFSPDGNRLVSGDNEGKMLIWKVQN
jgi:WD40 repeat protein